MNTYKWLLVPSLLYPHLTPSFVSSQISEGGGISTLSAKFICSGACLEHAFLRIQSLLFRLKANTSILQAAKIA